MSGSFRVSVGGGRELIVSNDYGWGQAVYGRLDVRELQASLAVVR